MINRKGPVFLHSLPTKYTSSCLTRSWMLDFIESLAFKGTQSVPPKNLHTPQCNTIWLLINNLKPQNHPIHNPKDLKRHKLIFCVSASAVWEGQAVGRGLSSGLGQEHFSAPIQLSKLTTKDSPREVTLACTNYDKVYVSHGQFCWTLLTLYCSMEKIKLVMKSIFFC